MKSKVLRRVWGPSGHWGALLTRSAAVLPHFKRDGWSASSPWAPSTGSAGWPDGPFGTGQHRRLLPRWKRDVWSASF